MAALWRPITRWARGVPAAWRVGRGAQTRSRATTAEAEPPATVGPSEDVGTEIKGGPAVIALDSGDADFVRHCLSRTTADLLTVGGVMDIMTRVPTEGVVERVLAAGEATPGEDVPRLALVGGAGTGKSVGLAHVAQRCHANGWVVATVPDAVEWCDKLQSIEVSKRDPERLDQYAASARWLQRFMAQNGARLGDIAVAGSYDFDTPLDTSGLDTLRDMAEFGVEALDAEGEGDPTIATDVVGIILKELRRQDLGTPVLITVDVYNGWLREVFPAFKDFDSKAVTPERASLIRHFLKATQTAKAVGAGAVLVAESTKGGVVAKQPLDGFDLTEYSEYTEDEVYTMLQHYRHRGYIVQDVSPAARSVLKHILSKNPRQFRKALSAL